MKKYLLISLALIVSAVALFSSCKKDDNEGGTTTPDVIAEPTDLQAEPSEAAVEFSWAAVAGAVKYEIRISSEDKFMTSEKPSAKMVGLPFGKEYKWEVRAVGSTGESKWVESTFKHISITKNEAWIGNWEGKDTDFTLKVTDRETEAMSLIDQIPGFENNGKVPVSFIQHINNADKVSIQLPEALVADFNLSPYHPMFSFSATEQKLTLKEAGLGISYALPIVDPISIGKIEGIKEILEEMLETSTVPGISGVIKYIDKVMITSVELTIESVEGSVERTGVQNNAKLTYKMKALSETKFKIDDNAIDVTLYEGLLNSAFTQLLNPMYFTLTSNITKQAE